VRVARAAAAHRGLAYQRHVSIETAKWRIRGGANPSWTNETAYLVGLMATDGGLTQRGKQIDFGSSDSELVETFISCLPRRRPRMYETVGKSRPEYRTQFKDAVLFRWLVDAGLMPRKSLTLGALSVPDALLSHVIRGLLDGDGCVINVNQYGRNARGEPYYWECLVTKFNSASPQHILWLRNVINTAVGIKGYVTIYVQRRHPLYILCYAKRESVKLPPWLYSDPDGPCLTRKRSIWANYRRRHAMDDELPSGRVAEAPASGYS